MDAFLSLVSALSAFAHSTTAAVIGFILGAGFIFVTIGIVALDVGPFSINAKPFRRMPTTKHAVHPDGLEKD